MIDTPDIALRLVAAVGIGGAVGLNRDLHHKPTGVRTLGLVALGAAMLALTAEQQSPPISGPVLQGVITGIGFIGAGVIMRGASEAKVQGLTTAAAVWLVAGFGLVAGLGAWPVLAIGAGLAALILLVGGQLEKAIRRMSAKSPAAPPDPP